MAARQRISGMIKLKETTALAIIFDNIRRKKRNTDLITIAKSFEYLVDLYGSHKAVADKVDLSAEMVRQFLTVLKLPKQVQQMFSTRRIDSVDVAKELVALKKTKDQIAVAKAIVDTISKDTRDIKRLAQRNDVSLSEAKHIILEAKPKAIHVFVIDFDDSMYKIIVKRAKTMNMQPPELIRKIVVDWIKHKRKK